MPGFVAELRPDLVVVSGDLTQRAKPLQFQEARALVERIVVPTLVVPGNHDVPLYRVWERLFSPYGAYRSHFSTETEPIYRDDQMLVVGVNSAHGLTFTQGRIRKSRLERLERQFAEEPQGVLKVAVIHHLLVPPPGFGHQDILTNAGRTVEVLTRCGVELVLSGHYHQAFVASSEEFYPAGRPDLWVLASGTSSSSRGRAAERGKNSCFSIDVEPGKIVVTHWRWVDERGGFRPRAIHRFGRHGASAVTTVEFSG